MSTPDGIYTVCGLRVDQDPPEEWAGVCGMPNDPLTSPDSAIAWLEQDIRGDPSDDGRVVTVGLALAVVHPGDVAVAGSLTRATMPVDLDEIRYLRGRHLDDPPQRWTVCGIDRATFAGLCYYVTAPVWLLAYVDALDRANDDGYQLLYSRTHPGHVPRIDGFPYADPLSQTAAGMCLYARDQWGVQF